MGHELTVSCVTSGRLDGETGSYDIRDGSITVGETDAARELVARHSSVSWADGEPESEPRTGGPDAEDSAAEVCGAEMSDGSTCERPAGECPYH